MSHLSNREIGNTGENLATNYLISHGYEIQEKNWRFSKAEIDIIAKEGEILVFVEVKTRSYTYYGKPEDSVNAKKEALIMDAAQRYMEKTGHDWEIRFDIISIILGGDNRAVQINHYKDAFFY